MDGSDGDIWAVPFAWGAATIMLIMVTLTMDPLWAYYGSFVAAFMTFASGMKVARAQHEERRLDVEDEMLQLEVREARAGNEGPHRAVDLERRQLSQDGDASE